MPRIDITANLARGITKALDAAEVSDNASIEISWDYRDGRGEREWLVSVCDYGQDALSVETDFIIDDQTGDVISTETTVVS